MKNQMKPRGLICWKTRNLSELDYSQWKYRIQRAISAQIKNEDIKLTDENRKFLLKILVGIDHYFSDDDILYVNHILNMTLPTWTKTKEYIKSKRVF